MLDLVSNLEYIQPHESLRDKFHSFIYLSDPICTGDIKVGAVSIDHGISMVSSCWNWDNVDLSMPIIRSVVSFKTLEELQDYVSTNIHAWWCYCGPEIEDDN